MKLKKFLAAVLIGIMTVSVLAACGTTSNTATNDTAANQAADESSDLEYIKDKGKMTIGITLFAPMNYKENGELTGFETEFAKVVCKKLGVEPDFQEINWDSKEVELNSKNIDCIWNGMTITDERRENMSITNSYMNNKQVMVVKTENLEKFSSSVDGASIVAEAGSTGEELAQEDEFFAAGKYTGVDSQAKALMDVASGTSDIAIVDYVTSIGSIGDDTDFAGLSVVEDKEFALDEYGVAFRKGSDVTEEVNNIIKELYEDGTLMTIAETYKLQDLLMAQ